MSGISEALQHSGRRLTSASMSASDRSGVKTLGWRRHGLGFESTDGAPLCISTQSRSAVAKQGRNPVPLEPQRVMERRRRSWSNISVQVRCSDHPASPSDEMTAEDEMDTTWASKALSNVLSRIPVPGKLLVRPEERRDRVSRKVDQVRVGDSRCLRVPPSRITSSQM